MKFILGRKLAMTQIFEADGRVIPATAILVPPNIVTGIKQVEHDQYPAVQLGFEPVKKIKKTILGQLKGLIPLRVMKEFRVDKADLGQLNRGDQLTVDIFSKGDKVKVTGWSKGRGFQGVVKRHGFHGSPASHGHKDQLRMPGSIGAGGVQRVFKGKKMAGQMGSERVTTSGLTVIEVDQEKNILYLKGAVAGARNSLVLISGPGEIKLTTKKNIENEIKEEKVEIKDNKDNQELNSEPTNKNQIKDQLTEKKPLT